MEAASEIISVSPAQKKLFLMIAKFTEDAIMGWVSCVWDHRGADGVRAETFPTHVLGHAELYFNSCAEWIYNRKDAYINSRFDEMMSVDLGAIGHRMDYLKIVVMLTLWVLNDINIPNLPCWQGPIPQAKNAAGDSVVDQSLGHRAPDNRSLDNRAAMMLAIKDHVHSLIMTNEDIAIQFRGCNHIHEPIAENDKTFTFQIVPKSFIDTLPANDSVI